MVLPDSFVAQQLVIKIGRLDHSRQGESARQELYVARELMAAGGHRHVVRAVQTYVATGMAFIVLEHCPGGSLFSHLVRQAAERHSQWDALHKLYQIAQGVQYLHQRNIAHRDLPLENILLTNNECKICDFGLSTRADVLSNEVVGKTQYAAPEVVHGDCSRRSHALNSKHSASSVCVACSAHGASSLISPSPHSTSCHSCWKSPPTDASATPLSCCGIQPCSQQHAAIAMES